MKVELKAVHPTVLILAAIAGCSSPARSSSLPAFEHASSTAASGRQSSVVLHDSERQRKVPIQVTSGTHPNRCTTEHRRPVAIISHGYGVQYTDYSFIVEALSAADYTVVSIQHDLPNDPPLATDGDLYSLRMPVWVRGAQNIEFVRRALAQEHPNLDFDHLLLVGHSNGGDLSLVFAREHPALTLEIVTLDHRRVPIPLNKAQRILSIRSSDMEPLSGVIPRPEQQLAFDITVRQLADARHDEMHDGGRALVKDQILSAITEFLARSLARKGR